MAKSDEDWKSRQDRRKEEDEDERARKKKQGVVSHDEKADLRDSLAGASTEKLDELIGRAEPLIDKINSLYNMFFSGAEQRPPVEQRKLLDQTMYMLQVINKPTASYQFRYNTVLAKYNTYTQRWDKRMKEIEDGKAKIRVEASMGIRKKSGGGGYGGAGGF